MTKRTIFALLAAAAICILVIAPASAVVQEIAYRGTLVSMNQSAGTVTVNAGYTYGCDFSNNTSRCSWTSVTPANLSGTVPDKAVFTLMKPGDQVAATSIGGAGGTWIGVAKVFPTPGIENWLATDVVGDPDSVPVGLAADYSFSYNTTADCSKCTGAVCNASSANITLMSAERIVLQRTLTNGGDSTYNGRNDNSSVFISFVSGQATADKCPGKGGMVGMQPVSTFVIHVNQGIAPAVTPSAPVTTTAPLTVTTTPQVTSPSNVPTTIPATKAGIPVIVTIIALGLTGLFLARRRS